VAYWIFTLSWYLYLGIGNETRFQIEKQIVVEEETAFEAREQSQKLALTVDQVTDTHPENSPTARDAHSSQHVHHPHAATLSKTVMAGSGHVVYHVMKEIDLDEEEGNENQQDPGHGTTEIAIV
jgi:hypothetical protein